MRSPWVRDAALRRSLPSTVEVVISERQPVGIGRLNGETYLLDERGVVIDQYGPQYADLDLPIIDGLTALSSDEGSATDVARTELASRLIAAVRSMPDMAHRVSQIDVTDVHNASVILSGDAAVIYVGEDQFLQRLQSVRRAGADAARARARHRLRGFEVRRAHLRAGRPASRAGRATWRRRRAGSGASGGDGAQTVRSAASEAVVARKERYLVGLDVGTSKVTAVVGEMLDGDRLDIVGLGVAESRGIRRGVVVNLEAAVESIKKAIDEAELMAGVEIDSVHLALSGPHVKGFNSRGRSPSPGRTGRSRRKTSARHRRGQSRVAAHGPRICTCCPRISSSTSRTASARRWA